LTGGPLGPALAGVTVYGTDPGSFMGYSVACGDIDGDSLADVIAGGPDTWSGFPGRAWAFTGATPFVAPPAEIFDGTGPGMWDLYGKVVAATGDLDGDSIGDLAIGAPAPDYLGATVAAMVEVYRGGALGGPPWGVLTSGATGDEFGYFLTQ
jgi:hypothetical protein